LANRELANWLEQPVNKVQSLGFRCWRSDTFDQNQQLDAKQLDRLIASGRTLKDDRTTTVAQVEFQGEHIIIKRYNARSQWHRINRAVRRSRASRSWRSSYKFARAGLNVAKPLLMLEGRLSLLRRTAYFVSECVDGQELLSSLEGFSAAEQQTVLHEIQTAFNNMRVAKLSHGDLKATNLIWHQSRLVFIDLDASRSHAKQRSWQAAHTKDRARLLKNWRNNEELLQLFSAI